MDKRDYGFFRNLALTILVFAAVFVGICALINRVGSASDSTEKELVRDAVRSAAITCYAVEGAYPMGLDYLKENYGLRYNEDAYQVVYDAFASNVMPSILVLDQGGDGE